MGATCSKSQTVTTASINTLDQVPVKQVPATKSDNGSHGGPATTPKQKVDSIPEVSAKHTSLTDDNKKKLFISYSWAHRIEDVRKMAQYLKTRDFDVWLDIERMHGDIRKQMVEGIDAADVVVVFFSQPYTREGSNTLNEITYAKEKNKKILLVRLQKDYKPDGQFLFMVAGLLWVDFDNADDVTIDGENVYNQIHMLLKTERKTEIAAIQPFSARFEPVKVPQFGAGYYSRAEDERRILVELITTCNKPGQGVLVIAADGGVGKTTIVSRLFNLDPTAVEKSAILSKATAVFWMNCFQWRDSFDETDQKAFDNELVELAKLCDPSFDSTTAARIVPHFREKKNMNVLFVFDDMFNVRLLQHFVENQKNSSLVSCCVITRDATVLTYSESAVARKVEKLEALSDEGIKKMLEDFYKMKGKLSSEQLATLSKFCCGLPLIASLIRARFGPEDGGDWGDIYAELIPSLTTLINQTLNNPKFATVLHLFEFSVNRLPADLRHCYYAFLFFDPAMPVSVKDLKVFWGLVAGIVAKFTTASLLRTAETSTKDELHFLVHQMLYEAALEKASEEFSLQGSNEERLRQLRFKLIGGELKNSSLAKMREMVVFEAVRQQRLTMCQRFVHVICAEDLATFCLQLSVGENGQQKLFLHFLYGATWPLFDKKYPEGHAMEKFGVNNSYRLIRAILLKLKRKNKLGEMFEQAKLKREVCLGMAAFLGDLFNDEEAKSQYWDRKPLANILSPWRTFFGEEKWKAEILAGKTENPLLAPLVRNDDVDFKLHYTDLSLLRMDQDETSNEHIMEAIVVAARCGQAKLLEFIWQQEDPATLRRSQHVKKALTYACQNGHLEVVKFLAENDSLSDDDGKLPMICAAENGHLDVVRFLAKKDSNLVSKANSSGQTPLMAAAVGGHLHVAKFLAEKDPNCISQGDNESWTAMLSASQNGHFDVVKLLAEKDPTSMTQAKSDGWTPMMSACQNGHLDIVTFLASKQPKSVSQAKNDGWTPMMSASRNGHSEVVRFLAEKDPQSVSLAKNDGWTPMMAACANGHLDVAKFLAEKDAKSVIQVRSKDGWAPIMSAAQNGHLEVVKFLVEKDPTSVAQAKSDGTTTALTAATQNGHSEVVNFLKNLATP